MFDVVKDTNQYLYHYTSKEVFFEYIIPDMSFRMSPFVLTNDPRESKDWAIGIDYDYEKGHEFKELIKCSNEVNHQFNKRLKAGVKISCFTLDNKKAMQPPNHSFGRGFSHSRMWAQYGENHKGVCIIFDKEKLISEFKEICAGQGRAYHQPVIYNDIPHHEMNTNVAFENIKKNGVEHETKKFVEMFYEPLFFMKNEDWVYEYEYRLLCFSESEDYFYFPIKDSIIGVCLGVDFPESYIPLLKDIRRKHGVRFARMQWYNGSPQATEFPQDNL